MSAFKTVYSSSIPTPPLLSQSQFYALNPLTKKAFILSSRCESPNQNARWQRLTGFSICVCECVLSVCVCMSGGSTINFHEFLLETIDGIYFVIYLVKWLPLVSHPLSLSLSFYLTLCFASCYCSVPLSFLYVLSFLCFCFGFHFCFCFCFCSFALHSFAVIRRRAAATGLALLLFPQHAWASPWSQRRGKHVNICHNWHKP